MPGNRLGLVAAAVSIAASLLGASSASAATTPVALQLMVDDRCFGGTEPAGSDVSLVHRTSEGRRIGAWRTHANSKGTWSDGCELGYIAPGDRLTIDAGQTRRTLVVPRLTVKVDRVHNIVSGVGPANTPVDLSLARIGNVFIPDRRAQATTRSDRDFHSASG